MAPEGAHAASEHDDDRVSLHPLSFEDALRGLVAVKPKQATDDGEGEQGDADG